VSEPKRLSDVQLLVPYVAERVIMIIDAMEARGFDPYVYESLRTIDRQRWLYCQGRSQAECRKAGVPAKCLGWAHPDAKKVTWTLKSKHLVAKAADVISKSRLWGWPEFYDALKQEAAKVGMTTIPKEGCHIQYGK
jgi:peptidoglycan L-alanyl-D-glutamate endopeptidase CwlK